MFYTGVLGRPHSLIYKVECKCKVRVATGANLVVELVLGDLGGSGSNGCRGCSLRGGVLVCRKRNRDKGGRCGVMQVIYIAC